MQKELFYNKIMLSIFFMVFMFALSTAIGTAYTLNQPIPQPW